MIIFVRYLCISYFYNIQISQRYNSPEILFICIICVNLFSIHYYSCITVSLFCLDCCYFKIFQFQVSYCDLMFGTISPKANTSTTKPPGQSQQAKLTLLCKKPKARKLMEKNVSWTAVSNFEKENLRVAQYCFTNHSW